MSKMTKWSHKEKQAWAVSKLHENQKETDKLPHKNDFDAATLSGIKTFLGCDRTRL